MPTYVGTSGGRIYFSADASVPTPTFDNVTGNYPGGGVTDVAMDPTNAQRVFVTRTGFGGSRLYRSTTGGTNWTAAGVGLPNVPANSVAVDPLNTNRIFVATDIGVYVSTDGGDNFTAFSAGLPLGIVVSDLEIDDAPHVLTLGSYSRGAWRVLLSTSATNSPPTPDFTATTNDLTATFTSTAIDFDGTIASYQLGFRRRHAGVDTAESDAHLRDLWREDCRADRDRQWRCERELLACRAPVCAADSADERRDRVGPERAAER